NMQLPVMPGINDEASSVIENTPEISCSDRGLPMALRQFHFRSHDDPPSGFAIAWTTAQPVEARYAVAERSPLQTGVWYHATDSGYLCRSPSRTDWYRPALKQPTREERHWMLADQAGAWCPRRRGRCSLTGAS